MAVSLMIMAAIWKGFHPGFLDTRDCNLKKTFLHSFQGSFESDWVSAGSRNRESLEFSGLLCSCAIWHGDCEESWVHPSLRGLSVKSPHPYSIGFTGGLFFSLNCVDSFETLSAGLPVAKCSRRVSRG